MVDHFSYGEAAFIRMNLSDVRMITVIMRILVKELLYRAVTGWILVLECLLSGAFGHLWLHPVMPDIKCRRFPRSWL
jgi:hypothetical protein